MPVMLLFVFALLNILVMRTGKEFVIKTKIKEKVTGESPN